MPAKISAKEILQKLSGISPAPMGDLKIVIEEQYTPRDFLAQRYKVALLVVRGNRKHCIAYEGDLVNPVSTAQNWMLACGLTYEDVIIKID